MPSRCCAGRATWMSSSASSAATVGDLLRDATLLLRASGTDTPRLDAELLLGHVLGVDRATLLAAPEAQVGEARAGVFAQLIDRRSQGEPVSYIRGIKEFYGLALSVDRRALIPRPETELLVDLALRQIASVLTTAPRAVDAPPLLAWDVGTGSGAVAVAIAVECRRRRYLGDVRLLATDTSTDALALAVENAVFHGVADAIDFAAADLTALPQAQAAAVLLANLPYVRSNDVPGLPVAARFEPALALDGGPDGLGLIARLAAQLPGALTERGVALIEFGSDQLPALEAIAREALPGWRVSIHDDLSGRPRVAEFQRAAP